MPDRDFSYHNAVKKDLSMCKKPVLSKLLNLGTLENLPDFSAGPRLSRETDDWLHLLKQAGYAGIQTCDKRYAKMALDCGMQVAVDPGQKIEKPDDIRESAQWAADFAVAMTAHIGNGFENDDEAYRLFEAVLECSQKLNLPVYPETHRATLLQDPYRSLRIIEKFPQLRLNGDFSHWYTGSEMIYGDFEQKIQYLRPALSRIRFIHARIGNTGHIQVEISSSGDESLHVQHFKRFWQLSFEGFLQEDDADVFYFAPELLWPEIGYACRITRSDGSWDEETDRWLQALVLCDIGEECFRNANQC